MPNNIKRPQSFRFITSILLFAITFFYCLTTLIEETFSLLIPNWSKFLLAIPFILVLTISTKWANKNIKRKFLLGLTIIIVVFSRDISESIFLGKQIAYTYLGQDAGYEELYLFSRGKCKVSNGGILGVSGNYYGTFKIIDTMVFIDVKGQIDLDYYTIKLENKILTIRRD